MIKYVFLCDNDGTWSHGMLFPKTLIIEFHKTRARNWRNINDKVTLRIHKSYSPKTLWENDVSTNLRIDLPKGKGEYLLADDQVNN